MKNKRFMVLMILLITIASVTQVFAAKNDKPKVLPTKNSNVSVTVGKTFIVELKDSEVKAWSYVISADQPERTIMEVAFEPKNDGSRKWIFMGTTPGQCVLTFTCTDLTGAPSKTITYNVTVEKEPEIIERITSKKGKTFTITLEQNPSTGYSWEYTIEPAEGLEVVSDMTADNDRKEAVGAPSKRILMFKGTQKGKYSISFTYSKAFAPEDNPQHVKYDVLIK